ncbi:MAG TPA: T9SS type A sorting domain-containing protein [Bacteroidetes bacterium]|nr:T9SS type A sorting domain-containing protein [Bacteroidota bacterium]
MKKYTIHIILLVVICANTSFSQVGYHIISNPDTAYSGLDLFYKDGFHVLGNAWNFNPPYSGVPIEGEYSYGNAYFFMDNDGVIAHRKYFNNNENLPSQEGFGRVPGTFFFSSDDSESFILPYTKHFGIVQCEDTLQGRPTDRLGITEVDYENDDYSISDTLFNLEGICESQWPIGYFAGSDSFLLMLKDNYDDMSISFNWYDYQFNLLSQTGKSFQAFEARTTGTAVDESGNLILLGWDATDEYNLSLLKVSPDGDSLVQANALSSTHPFTPIAIAGGQGSDILVAAYRYNMDYSEIEYFLLCFDEGLNEKWRKQFPFNIRAIAALGGGQGYLVASMPVSGQPSPFNVGFLDSEGGLISSEDYGEENDIPEKIKILDDSLFAVIGTKFIGYQNSTTGNPYASIFVSVDTLQKLVVSDVQEKVGSDVQIEVYPNPTTGILNISVGSDFGISPRFVEINSLAGRKLGYQYLDPTEDKAILNLSYLPAGTYIGTLHFEDGKTKSFKISICQP